MGGGGVLDNAGINLAYVCWQKHSDSVVYSAVADKVRFLDPQGLHVQVGLFQQLSRTSD